MSTPRWTPIRTMRRGARPDFTPLREPANNYVTPAQQWFIDQLLDLEPGTQDTDSGGYAHKPGYHDTVAHNDARSGMGKDYSARDSQDRSGPHDKTRARDWGFTRAWSRDYTRFELYGDRIMAAYRVRDPRLAGWREYLGRVSTPVTVNGKSTRRVGIDFRHQFLRIPDSSHDTHGHFSESTEHVESHWNKWALLTILAGWTVQEWRQSLEEDDTTMSALTDAEQRELLATVRSIKHITNVAGYRVMGLATGKTAIDNQQGDKAERVWPVDQLNRLRLTGEAVLAKVTADDGDVESILRHVDQLAATLTPPSADEIAEATVRRLGEQDPADAAQALVAVLGPDRAALLAAALTAATSTTS